MAQSSTGHSMAAERMDRKNWSRRTENALAATTLLHLPGSRSLGYLSLVGTCREHHYLTRLTPPTPRSVMELKGWWVFFLPLASVLLAEAECWGISWDAAEVL